MIAVAYRPDGLGVAAAGSRSDRPALGPAARRRSGDARRSARGLLEPRIPPRRPDAGHRRRRPAGSDPGPGGEMGQARGRRPHHPALGPGHGPRDSFAARPRRLGPCAGLQPGRGTGSPRPGPTGSSASGTPTRADVLATLEGHTGAVFALAYQPRRFAARIGRFRSGHPDLGRGLGPNRSGRWRGIPTGCSAWRSARTASGWPPRRRPDGAALGPGARAGGARPCAARATASTASPSAPTAAGSPRPRPTASSASGRPGRHD